MSLFGVVGAKKSGFMFQRVHKSLGRKASGSNSDLEKKLDPETEALGRPLG